LTARKINRHTIIQSIIKNQWVIPFIRRSNVTAIKRVNIVPGSFFCVSAVIRRPDPRAHVSRNTAGEGRVSMSIDIPMSGLKNPNRYAVTLMSTLPIMVKAIRKCRDISVS
jgi:hypothetical protein